ncbi:helix-turn-helix transcriptional regulator [Salmonella enterica]|nr:helix-turn-helix transcriptional regulator [Salmonella enterica]EHR6350623.1 helix-turn-helix transcriptional regulator [Salmonella enterica]EIP6461468.1 helix-turn-helix transcriptional regulator [Salmonella enterica]EIV6891830.1 helix-turn-helix transcriptional regulator [Salmonella enterica]EJI7838868.1 helix-turn-helix transcriptional regulator [Salmonella enterica]
MESISQRLKFKREEMNLSQTQLAELVGMTQQSLQAIEAGLTKRPRYIVELSSALNCDPHWLLYGENINQELNGH